jgi:hypothetical protein
MKRSPLILLLALPLAGCQTMQHITSARVHPAAVTQAYNAWPSGKFDNHEQVWSAHESAANAITPPHVVIAIDATSQKGWSLWHVHLDVAPPIQAVWAMQATTAADGTEALRPYRALLATPATGAAFKATQWAPLDACSLHGKATAAGDIDFVADATACAAIAPEIGTAAAVLPLEVRSDGDWLHVRLYADQARGSDAREDARRVQIFAGWAAINGGGPKGAGDSTDWHMNRHVKVENEGGRSELTWRDGKPSGYSIGLERLTYREGNVPVLKLSVIEDATGRALAYAWANPQATRIGINLGWVQVGLERASVTTAAKGKSSKSR